MRRRASGPETVPDIRTVDAQCGDRLLICSDGLSDELDDEALATVLGAGLPPQRTAEMCIAAALEAGGHDNATALVVDMPPWEDVMLYWQNVCATLRKMRKGWR